MRGWLHLPVPAVLLVASLWLMACGGQEAPSASPTAATPTVTPSPTAISESTTGFFLDIEEPKALELVVSTPTAAVVGRTRVDAVVSVNDVFADVDGDGRFTVPVQLEEGPNVIEVVASVETGEELAKILTIIYSP